MSNSPLASRLSPLPSLNLPASNERARPFRLAVVCDYPEEGWVSMDLCAEMLEKHLNLHFGSAPSFPQVAVTRLCPPFRRRASRLPALGRRKAALNADRAMNRFRDYPRWLRKLRNDFDLFHVVDHSYAHLVHSLPADRTVVTCNDLDAFRCLIDPQWRRSRPFQAMARHTLSGMQRAACVTCISQATANELHEHDLLPPERTVPVPLAADPVFSPAANPVADAAAARYLGSRQLKTEPNALASVARQGALQAQGPRLAPSAHTDSRPPLGVQGPRLAPSVAQHPRLAPSAHTDSRLPLAVQPDDPEVLNILHVGSTIPRKRIDVLLNVFAATKRRFPQARLIRAGGPFTGEQLDLVQRLGLSDSVLVLPFIQRDVLAAVYRRASLVLQPSEAESFGLPIVEAMACGVPVVASDLPVLREVGGTAATFCPVGDVDAWGRAVESLLGDRTKDSKRWAARRHAAINQAAKFSWKSHVTAMMQIYADVLRSADDKRVG